MLSGNTPSGRQIKVGKQNKSQIEYNTSTTNLGSSQTYIHYHFAVSNNRNNNIEASTIIYSCQKKKLFHLLTPLVSHRFEVIICAIVFKKHRHPQVSHTIYS